MHVVSDEDHREPSVICRHAVGIGDEESLMVVA